MYERARIFTILVVLKFAHRANNLVPRISLLRKKRDPGNEDDHANSTKNPAFGAVIFGGSKFIRCF